MLQLRDGSGSSRVPEVAPAPAALKGRVHSQLIERLDLAKVGLLPPDVLQAQIRRIVEDMLVDEETPLNRQEREQLIVEV